MRIPTMHDPCPWSADLASLRKDRGAGTTKAQGTAMPQGRPGEAHADDRPVVHERTARRAELVLDGFGPWDDATVLDVGCESGGFVSLASVCGARIAYIDAAPELVEIAVYRMPDGALVVCDVAELPYVDAGFATLTAMTGLPYAVDPVHALAEAARVAC